ncbi:MAG: hypothetical protein PVJ21_17385 [Anaerolineales bacterium]|jgi:hypothetical protein
MKYKNIPLLFITAGMGIVIAIGTSLATATPVSAQCGSQASSCKNCHEVQGQDPVNSDGTDWHQSHAFGDFCYICHGGNQQATDKDAAHQGMEDPLSDIQAACQQCHATDLEARAQVYATALGVTLGSGSASPTPDASEAAPVSADSTPAAAVSSTVGQNCNDIVVKDPDAVDYAQNYDEIVLGKKPINWGNSILIGVIGLVLVGGGGFVVTREKLINAKFGDTRKVEDEYPADVVEMLPKIAGLKAGARKSLKKNILNDPKKADKVLDLIDAILYDEKEE